MLRFSSVVVGLLLVASSPWAVHEEAVVKTVSETIVFQIPEKPAFVPKFPDSGGKNCGGALPLPELNGIIRHPLREKPARFADMSRGGAAR